MAGQAKEQAGRTFSLIIPVYKPDARFAQLARRVAAQSALPRTVVIAETVSGQGEAYLREALEIFGSLEGCALRHFRVTPEEFDHGGTRDRAARLCGGDVLVFMTMDALPADRRLFGNLLAAFDEPGTACAYARQLPAADAGPIERYTRRFNYPDTDMRKTGAQLAELGIKTYFCSNVCAAYDRAIYLELGGFVKRTIFNEDMIYAGRAVQAGYAVSYRAGARVIHSHNYTGIGQFHRNFDLGVSQAQHPEVFDGLSSDGEGLRLVKKTLRYLLATGQAGYIPALVWQSGWKYLGYRLGKGYRHLPMALVRGFSLQKAYWK